MTAIRLRPLREDEFEGWLARSRERYAADMVANAGFAPDQADNITGTINVLEAARLHGAKKIILASSSSVYGVGTKVPFAESSPIFSPISPYAASKLACEALLTN